MVEQMYDKMGVKAPIVDKQDSNSTTMQTANQDELQTSDASELPTTLIPTAAAPSTTQATVTKTTTQLPQLSGLNNKQYQATSQSSTTPLATKIRE